MALLFFGPEGVRTDPFVDVSLTLGGVMVSGQTLLIVSAAIVFSGAAVLPLFDFTLLGKALRATAMNRTGARLMGISPARAGLIAYLAGSLMAAVSGILIAPVDTIFYDSGFLIGLKAFVGAIIGGMVSYPADGAWRAAGRHARKLRRLSRAARSRTSSCSRCWCRC